MAMNDFITFSTATEVVRLPSDGIVYVAADGNYSDIVMADRSKFTLTMQLGQIEERLCYSVEGLRESFIRVGRSLIINRRYIAHVNPTLQRLVLSDCRSFRFDVSASRDSLKKMKEMIELEEKL